MPEPKRPTQKVQLLPQHVAELSRRDRRRVLVRVLLGVALMDAILFLVYARIPIDDATGAGLIVMFAILLGIFAIVILWQIRAIVKARLPGVRAAAAIAFAVPVYLVLWSLVYLAMAAGYTDAFNEPLDRVGAFYFTTTVFTTVGFGDITAANDASRIAVSCQMILNLVIIGALVKLMLGVAQQALARNVSSDNEEAIAELAAESLEAEAPGQGTPPTGGRIPE